MVLSGFVAFAQTKKKTTTTKHQSTTKTYQQTNTNNYKPQKNNEKPPFAFGLRSGLGLSNFHFSAKDKDLAKSSNDATKSFLSYAATAFVEFGIAKNLLIQPGVSLINKGSKTEEKSGDITNTIKFSILAVEVPINVIYRYPLNDRIALQFNGGPFASFNVAGTARLTEKTPQGSDSNSEDLKFGSSEDSNLSSTEFGFNVGAGIWGKPGFGLGLNYAFGLSNLIPKDKRDTDSGEKISSRVISLMVTYSF